MCDKDSEQDIQAYLSSSTRLNRRDFNKLLALGTLAAGFPQFASAADVVESNVFVATPDGTADCYFVRPATGKHPAVLMWPDIKGLRPAFKAMAKRLASAGYAVLVLNPFYRDVKGLALPAGVEFPSEEAWKILRGYRAKLTSDAVVRDARACFAYLDKQPEVSKKRGAAAMGYCMSGSFVMRAAAAMPERIKAIASFHGGGLATSEPDSPHLTIPQSTAAVLHAIAENDDKKDPQMKQLLGKAYGSAKLPAEIEVYPGTLHGWCPPDSKAYNDVQAEKAWSRTFALFDKALNQHSK